MLHRACVFAVFFLTWSAKVMAQAPRYYVPPVPDSMDALDFFLTTAGVGHEVNDRFGHTGVRVVDRTHGTDVVFNWGQFSFDDPGFLWKFFRGQLDYSMGVHSLRSEIHSYREMGRRLVMEHLNLTAGQKRKLFAKIAWNALPEHRQFSYQYWFKNCSTIPRDYINETLSHQVFEHFGKLPAEKVFRDYVRGNLSYTPFVAPGLDVLMNSNIDQPITAWQDMFLPHNLRAWLLKMPAVDDAGKEVPGQMLLGDSEVLVDETEDFTPPFNDYVVLILPLILAVALGLGLLLRRRAAGGAGASWGYRWLGMGVAYWGLLAGITGVTLLINWGFSGHPDGWHNTNLLLFWPIDWLFLPLGIRLIRTGVAQRRMPLVGPYARQLCYLHVASLLLLCLLTAAHVFAQNIWRAAAWFGLPMVAMLAALIAYGFVQEAAAPALAAQRRSLLRRLGVFS